MIENKKNHKITLNMCENNKSDLKLCSRAKLSVKLIKTNFFYNTELNKYDIEFNIYKIVFLILFQIDSLILFQIKKYI